MSKSYRWIYLPAVAIVVLVVVVAGLAASESPPKVTHTEMEGVFVPTQEQIDAFHVDPAPVPPMFDAPYFEISPPHEHPAPVSDDCWIGLARSVGWPEDTLGTLARIIRRESGCDPSAYADRPSTMDNSRGLLQINAYGNLDQHIRNVCGIEPEALFDAETNLGCGLVYFGRSGWSPWGGA